MTNSCDVIIPIGPGHETLHRRAIESVRIAVSQNPAWGKIRVIPVDDTKGQLGRSAARNMGVQKSDAAWVFFLDADDVMHPHALIHAGHWLQDKDAVWGLIVELSNGTLRERYQVPELSSYEQLLAFDPYLTLQMGHFVRRDVALKHPFSETMDCGEDWLYYLDVWKNHDCVKICRPLMCNQRGQHSKGPRSATGTEWTNVVHGLIQEARKAASKEGEE